MPSRIPLCTLARRRIPTEGMTSIADLRCCSVLAPSRRLEGGGCLSSRPGDLCKAVDFSLPPLESGALAHDFPTLLAWEFVSHVPRDSIKNYVVCEALTRTSRVT